MNHKQKVHKANKMRSRAEKSTYYTTEDKTTARKKPTSIFDSHKWNERKKAKLKKITTKLNVSRSNRVQLREKSNNEVSNTQ